mgnify:FL=1
MIKLLIKIFGLFILSIIILIFYLSFFGIKTKIFNDQIESKILGFNKQINLELQSVKLLLNPFDFTANLNTKNANLFFNNKQIQLESIKTNISLKALINKDFSIDDLKISTKETKIYELVSLARSVQNSPKLFILDSIFKEGSLVLSAYLRFDKKGKVKKDYEIEGYLKNAKLNFLNKLSIKDLNLNFNIKHKRYNLETVNGYFNQIKLASSTIQIEEKNNQFLINGKFINNKKDFDINLFNDLLGINFKDYNLKKIIFSSENDFKLDLDKKLRISNLDINSKINLERLVYKNNFSKIKNYLPNLKDLIELKDHEILINYKKNNFNIGGAGSIQNGDNLEKLNYKVVKKNDKIIFDTSIDINKSALLVNELQYSKKENSKSTFNVKGIFTKDHNINFDLISFVENKNNFLIENLKLNNKFKVLKIEKLKLDYVNDNKIKNKINLKKIKNEYKIFGKIFDISTLIDEVLMTSDNDNDNNTSIFHDLNTTLYINIDKTYLDKETSVNDLNGQIIFKKNKIYKLDLDSDFSNNKKLTFTINTNELNEKITTLFSDYPKPIVKRYKFIKGFEEGTLDFNSIKKNDTSNSVLVIDNFKIQEVPVLAKLLTLASLQGIADLLTGEGIRFTDFEMKFTNKKGITTIDEMYAIGPAISILLDGYIQSEKLVSLRGTLVPATTINRSIASIPLLGKILVGKKVGEGVFGVSFKIKGPPKNLKTSVNPIKTLTPRFITRTLEKIKKN